jgi:UDP-N-acetylmuramyl pentapeptide phosphotransferase/UDP-N-acetylglucosamine-1-phosphate transferase
MLVLAPAALGLGYLLTRMMEAAARRWNWIDRPTPRGSHTQPVPRGGGVAIVAVTLLGAASALATENRLTTAWIAIFVIASAVALVSWIDDVRSLSTTLRFGVHLAAAAGVVALLGPIPSIAAVPTAMFGVPLTLLWIAGLTNAYNFMDGIDGIAGSQAVVAGAGWCAIGYLTRQPVLFYCGGFLGAASLGFLIRNWMPARIFMGDVGSAFTGFFLGALTVYASAIDPRLFMAGLLMVWPFVFDTTLTLLRRLRAGERITQPHNSHLYQRLVKSGWSHAESTSLYAALSLAGTAAAVAVAVTEEALAPVAIFTALAAAGLFALVSLIERRVPRAGGVPSP